MPSAVAVAADDGGSIGSGLGKADDDETMGSMIDGDYIEKELSITQKALEDIEQRLKEALGDDSGDHDNAMASTHDEHATGDYGYVDSDDDDDYQKFLASQQQGSIEGEVGHTTSTAAAIVNDQPQSLVEKLNSFDHKAEALKLVQDIIDWMKGGNGSSSIGGGAFVDEFMDNEDNEQATVYAMFVKLGSILLSHNPQIFEQVIPDLYNDKYMPLYDYLYDYCLAGIQHELNTARYPTAKGCNKLVQSCRKFSRNSRKLISNSNVHANFPQLCQWLLNIETIHYHVTRHWNNNSEEGSGGYSNNYAQPESVIIKLLLESVVERIQFHFLATSPDRPTTTRNDRFIEWFLSYVQEHVLGITSVESGNGGDGPWQVVLALNECCTPAPTTGGDGDQSSSTTKIPSSTPQSLAYTFIQEVLKVVVYVIQVERQIFRTPQLVGVNSNPQNLINSIQELFQFDFMVQNNIQPLLLIQQQQQQQSLTLTSLVTTLIANDKQLFDWFLQREHEVIFTTLLDDSNIIKPSMNNISPRAEIFCSLIKSIQCKSSLLFTGGGSNAEGVVDPGAEYVRYIAVPLCTAFVDAVHEASTDLRNILLQRPLIGSMGGVRSSSSSLVNLTDLASNIQEWIELINGTHLSATVLIRPNDWQSVQTQNQQREGSATGNSGVGTSSTGKSWTDHDLARFGQSLERLESVLIEEFAASLVETILMERAKLASYLMMASHVLASENWGDDEDDGGFGDNPAETSFGGGSSKSHRGVGVMQHHDDELSAELKETNVVLSQFLRVCSRAVGPNAGGTIGGDLQEGGPSDLPSQVARLAPSAIRDHVLNRLADKFMEVALDVHSMTPDIYQAGAAVFARDVQTLLGDSASAAAAGSGNELPLLQRLLDLTRLMSSDSSSLQGLSHALIGLAGVTFLDPHDFASDAALHQEAMSMIQAKGFNWLELDDVISVLNRRRDL